MKEKKSKPIKHRHGDIDLNVSGVAVEYISNLIEAQQIYKSKDVDTLKKQDLISNLIEAYPGMKMLVDGVENKTLTYEDLMLVMADIPYHMKKAYEVWYGQLMD